MTVSRSIRNKRTKLGAEIEAQIRGLSKKRRAFFDALMRRSSSAEFDDTTDIELTIDCLRYARAIPPRRCEAELRDLEAYAPREPHGPQSMLRIAIRQGDSK